jgi:hypothetical protein
MKAKSLAVLSVLVLYAGTAYFLLRHPGVFPHPEKAWLGYPIYGLVIAAGALVLGLIVLFGVRWAALLLAAVFTATGIYATYVAVIRAASQNFRFKLLGGRFMAEALVVIVLSFFFAGADWAYFRKKS